jgi:valyl-tRNA synthetase
MSGLVTAFRHFQRPEFLKRSLPSVSLRHRFRPLLLSSSVSPFSSCKHDELVALASPNFRKEIESKHFDYNKMEKEIYQWWEKNGYFQPKDGGMGKFVISMPPPNVTGYLHMGHAIFLALQDLMIRYHRMRGVTTLWTPGT